VFASHTYINVVCQVSWYLFNEISTCTIKILSNNIIKFIRALKHGKKKKLLTKFNKDEIQNVKRKFKTITMKFSAVLSSSSVLS
jgi:hypothetical protein